MASLALMRLLSSAAVAPRTFRPAVSSRLLSTNAARSFDDDMGDEGFYVKDRRFDDDVGDEGFYIKNPRSNRSTEDSYDQFFTPPRRSFWNQNPQNSDEEDQLGRETLNDWVEKEKDDALHLWFDMPGLSREDVKVALELNCRVLVIKGQGGDEEEVGRKFSMRRGLPENVYKTDEIKAEMKNGVLKLVVPKLKEEERSSNVRHIRVD